MMIRSVWQRVQRGAVVGATALLAGLGLGLTASPGHAQVALDQFAATPLATDGFALSRPQLLEKGQWGLIGVMDYAKNPLVRRQTRGGDIQVVENQFVLHLGFGIGVGKNFTGYAMLPVNLVMNGEDARATRAGVDKADGGGLGDLAFGGRLRLYGGNADKFALTGELLLRVPTARLSNNDQNWSGDKIGNAEPALVAEYRLNRVDLRLRGGFRLRAVVKSSEVEAGQAFVYGAGVRVLLVEDLYANAELYGMSDFSNFFSTAKTPLELLLGPKYHWKESWFFGAAAGPGIVAGVGSPDFRIIGTVGWAQPAKPEAAPVDSDGDGLLDPNDACPNDPEDKDQFADDDGCPDPDNDKDGVADADDACPLDPEDADGFEDENGCPDANNDKDNLKDDKDACPNDPEDMDNFEDENGCPDLDNDKDGVADANDKCPNDAGPVESQGCPKILVTKSQIVINERVEFATGKATLLAASNDILEAVAKVLTDNPDIKRIRIEGHTDDVGKPARNLTLSKNRVTSVARWFTKHGIAVTRLEGYGCGQTRPLVANDSDANRQANRRVEFYIVDPPSATPRDEDGCVTAPVK